MLLAIREGVANRASREFGVGCMVYVLSGKADGYAWDLMAGAA